MWGRYLVGRPGRYDIDERSPEVLRRLGWRAEVLDGRVRLSGCPCPVVCVGRPGLLCELAAGVLEVQIGAASTRT